MPKLYLNILFLIMPLGLWAQGDSVSPNANRGLSINQNPESQLRLQQKNQQDSLKKVADSLTFLWVGIPDSNRKNQFRDSLIKEYQVYNLDFAAWAKKFIKNKNHEGEGKPRKQGQRWVLLTILLLILGFSVLKSAFNKEIAMIMNAFFDHRFLSQGPAAGNFFNTWLFFFLYLLFGFTLGMYLFLAGKFFHLTYPLSDLSWYFALSLMVILLFTVKIYALRFLGFLLQAEKAVKTYTSILFLSYFHAAILFLPLILAFSLSQAKYAGVFLYAGMLITALILLYQLVRVSIHILSHYQFSKFYLFIYFCALEICPILILIKALRF